MIISLLLLCLCLSYSSAGVIHIGLEDIVYPVTLRHISRQNVTVIRGGNLTMSVQVTNNNLALEGKWIKKSIIPPRTTNTTELIVEDTRRSIYTEAVGNNSVIETLQITETTTMDSGIYLFVVKLKDFLKTIEFEVIVENIHAVHSDESLAAKVIVESINAVPRMEIMIPSSFVRLDQRVYPYNMEVTVVCLMESHSVSSGTPVTLLYKNAILSSFNEPPSGSLTKVSGTFEKGYIWTLLLVQPYTELKCLDRSNTKNFANKTLTMDYEGVPSINITTRKPKRANENEDEKEIYEGDDITFTWENTEAEQNWTPSNVTWLFKGKVVKSFVNLVKNKTNLFNYTIKNILPSQSGEYVCLCLLYGVEAQYKRIIEVIPVEKPYRTSPNPKDAIELIYDSEVTFSCEMDGTPKPKYNWTKDGKPFRSGKFSSDNYTLTITRVTAEDNGEFQCTAINRAGFEQYQFTIKVNEAPERISGLYLDLFAILGTIIVACLFVAVLKYRKQKKRTERQEIAMSVLFKQLNGSSDSDPLLNPDIPINQQRLAYKKEYEIERENLEIGEQLGSGEFGAVWKGWLKKPGKTSNSEEENRLAVAVKGAKSILNPTHCQMLVDELKAFCAIGRHPNVLALVGAVTKNIKSGDLFIAMELCEKGCLKDYLRSFRESFIDELRMGNMDNSDYLNGNISPCTLYAVETNPEYSTDMDRDRLRNSEPNFLSTSDLISFSLQVASGMEYIAGIPCIHRDLAARNVLVTNQRICKVADFGMARNDEYYKKHSNNLPTPYRWMALEAIELGSYTEKTDIWSFGILLYEIFTLGTVPYASIPSEQLLDRLKLGHRNTKPQYSHDGIYGLMMQCWDEQPHLRPSFTQCVTVLQQHLKMASPQLSDRLSQEIEDEVERQQQLSKWLKPDEPGQSTSRIDAIQLPIPRNHSQSSKNRNSTVSIKKST